MDSFGSNKARKLVLPRNRRWWWWCIQQHPWTVSAETTSPHIGGAILINLVSYWYVTFKLLFWRRTFIASRIHNTPFLFILSFPFFTPSVKLYFIYVFLKIRYALVISDNIFQCGLVTRCCCCSRLHYPSFGITACHSNADLLSTAATRITSISA